MKKEFSKSCSVLIIILLFILPGFIVASSHGGTTPPAGDGGTTPPSGQNAQLQNPLQGINSLPDFVRAAVNTVQNIGFIVAVFFIIYSGFLFVKAQGNPEELKKARQAFLWAIVGTAVLLGAWIFAQAIDTTVRSLGVDGSEERPNISLREGGIMHI